LEHAECRSGCMFPPVAAAGTRHRIRVPSPIAANRSAACSSRRGRRCLANRACRRAPSPTSRPRS
jgi:hypothetical protein